jgi:hypothetical protein
MYEGRDERRIRMRDGQNKAASGGPLTAAEEYTGASSTTILTQKNVSCQVEAGTVGEWLTWLGETARAGAEEEKAAGNYAKFCSLRRAFLLYQSAAYNGGAA